jgi:hypothetical protein
MYEKKMDLYRGRGATAKVGGAKVGGAKFSATS